MPDQFTITNTRAMLETASFNGFDLIIPAMSIKSAAADIVVPLCYSAMLWNNMRGWAIYITDKSRLISDMQWNYDNMHRNFRNSNLQ